MLSTNRRSAARNSVGPTCCCPTPLANRMASDGSPAALASLFRMPSKNSPAALRVKVSAMIRSGASPHSSSRIKRLVS